MDASANLLVLPLRFTLAGLAPKVVQGAPEGSQGGSKEGTLGGFGAALGSLGIHLETFSDGFDVILELLGDLF